LGKNKMLGRIDGYNLERDLTEQGQNAHGKVYVAHIQNHEE